MAFIEPTSGSLARIKVVGVGGGGQNAVTSMIKNQGEGTGVEFICMNTDLQALNSAASQIRIQIGPERTHGLGSGADPQIGYESATESTEDIKAHLQGADMVFIAAGLGGGTGTGAGPVVAQISKELGALTVGVVTKPFGFEGKRRMSQAEQGIRELRDKVDALIVIPNQKLLDVVDKETPLTEAFKIADQVVGKAVEGISELITSTGLVNVDFADVKAVMKNAGSALMGIGEANGENRAEKAANAAINSPLLDVDIKGSTGVLINIVGDSSLTMHEVNKAAEIVSNSAHEGANIIFGANIDPDLEGIRVTVIATGFDSGLKSAGMPAGFPSISDKEVMKQIDSRVDSKDVKEEDSDDDENDVNKVSVDHDDQSNGYRDDEGAIDLNKMREELKKEETSMELDDQDLNSGTGSSDDNDDSDDNKKDDSGFWKFIKSKQ